MEKCTYTGEKLEITEEFFKSVEIKLLGASVTKEKREAFRKETQKEYTTRTLTQEIMVEGLPITETEIYESLHGLSYFDV